MSTVIRTIRTEKTLDKILRDDAQKKGISINLLVNQLLEKYVLTYRFIETFPSMIIPSDMIKELLDGLDEKYLNKMGDSAGSYIPKHSLFLKGMAPNLENVMLLMEKVCDQCANWYQFKSHSINGKLIVLLRHNFGKKWSIYLGAYYSSLFKEILGIKINSEIGDGSLAIIFPKSVKINNNNNREEKIQKKSNNGKKVL